MLDIKKLLAKLIEAHSDTGWKVLWKPSTSGYIEYRKIGNIVFLQGYSLSVTHNVTFYTLPPDLRPIIRHTVPMAFPLGVCGYVNIFENGQMAAIQNGGGTINQLYFATSYPV